MCRCNLLRSWDKNEKSPWEDCIYRQLELDFSFAFFDFSCNLFVLCMILFHTTFGFLAPVWLEKLNNLISRAIKHSFPWWGRVGLDLFLPLKDVVSLFLNHTRKCFRVRPSSNYNSVSLWHLNQCHRDRTPCFNLNNIKGHSVAESLSLLRESKTLEKLKKYQVWYGKNYK